MTCSYNIHILLPIYLYLLLLPLTTPSSLPHPSQTIQPPTPPLNATPTLHRKDVITITVYPTATSTGPGPSTTADTSLKPATSGVPLDDVMGLIMPNPFQPLYVGLNYTFGFVDPAPKPAPTIGGFLRQIIPVLIMPDYTVDVFPWSGTTDPESLGAFPGGLQKGLCGTTAEPYSVGYPFIFIQPGWYMFVINQTWVQPSITNNTCTVPLLSQKTFFSTQLLSVSPLPSTSPSPASPSSAYTVFADVTTDPPGVLPIDPEDVSSDQARAVGLGVAVGIVGLLGILGGVLFVRRKHRMEREVIAFNRLKPEEQTQFLLENPTHPFNRQQRSRAGYQPPFPIYHQVPVPVPYGQIRYVPPPWSHPRQIGGGFPQQGMAQMPGLPVLVHQVQGGSGGGNGHGPLGVGEPAPYTPARTGGRRYGGLNLFGRR